MRPFTILCITILLACTAQVWRFHQEATAIEQYLALGTLRVGAEPC